jgi:hypothetical protein
MQCQALVVALSPRRRRRSALHTPGNKHGFGVLHIGNGTSPHLQHLRLLQAAPLHVLARPQASLPRRPLHHPPVLTEHPRSPLHLPPTCQPSRQPFRYRLQPFRHRLPPAPLPHFLLHLPQPSHLLRKYGSRTGTDRQQSIFSQLVNPFYTVLSRNCLHLTLATLLNVVVHQAADVYSCSCCCSCSCSCLLLCLTFVPGDGGHVVALVVGCTLRVLLNASRWSCRCCCVAAIFVGCVLLTYCYVSILCWCCVCVGCFVAVSIFFKAIAVTFCINIDFAKLDFASQAACHPVCLQHQFPSWR